MLGDERAEKAAQRPPDRMLVVILNFNGLTDTLECLDSLRVQTWQGFDVLVIDNGSRDAGLGAAAVHFNGVEVLALPENRGWAGGNNVGLRIALERGYGHVCLLNNDTVLDPPALGNLMAASALIGRPCLLHPAIAYFDPPGVWQLCPPAPAEMDAEARRLWDDANIVAMDWAYGACLVLQAGVIHAVGLLDERFFLQLEETDYFWRAKALGIGSFCARRARILHKESASFGARMNATKLYYQVRNSLLLAEKQVRTPGSSLRTLRNLLWALQRLSGGAAGWAGLLKWSVSADPLPRAARQGAFDYLRRRFGPRPAAPERRA